MRDLGHFVCMLSAQIHKEELAAAEKKSSTTPVMGLNSLGTPTVLNVRQRIIWKDVHPSSAVLMGSRGHLGF